MDDGVLIENIGTYITDEQAAVTRLISLSLRHGADIKHCVDVLEKVPGDLHNFAHCQMSIGSFNFYDIISNCTYTVGSNSSDMWAVKIVDGPFADFIGKIDSVDGEKGKVRVLVSIFGRETPVELDFLQIKKI